jgi:hypothetical protein
MVSTRITQGVPSSPVAPTGEEGTPCEFLLCIHDQVDYLLAVSLIDILHIPD